MEFRPSNRDVLDAFKLRIMSDDQYVIDCLVKSGLSSDILGDEYYHARKRILKDFRSNYTPLMKTEDYDVTDTFKSFVDENGRYHRKSPIQSVGELVVELGKEGSFEVFKRRKDTAFADYDIRINEREIINSEGIETKRISQREVYHGETHSISTSVSTRQEDMATFKTVESDDQGRITESMYIVSPEYEAARTLDGYYPITESGDVGIERTLFTKEEVPTLIKFVRRNASLPEELKQNEYSDDKDEIDL